MDRGDLSRAGSEVDAVVFEIPGRPGRGVYPGDDDAVGSRVDDMEVVDWCAWPHVKDDVVDIRSVDRCLEWSLESNMTVGTAVVGEADNVVFKKRGMVVGGGDDGAYGDEGAGVGGVAHHAYL